MRRCTACGGPTTSPKHRYCDECRERVERRRRIRQDNGRPGTTARGYGVEHQRLRKFWAPKVAAGDVNCARCGRWIEPGAPWDLGHVDGVPGEYQGPEHEACNRATSGRRGRGRVRRQSQEW